MRNKILVIGGYGDVGSRICLLLAEHFPGRVMAAGRNLEKAQRFSKSTEGKVLARKIDVYEKMSDEILSDVQLVIMALDLEDLTFVKQCFSQGVGYIDISASYEQIQGVAAFHDLAEKNEVTGIISVGLDPGLSNLLAKYCYGQLHVTNRLEISILLGLGEYHGEASIDWILKNLQQDFTLKMNGISQKVRSFQDKRPVDFPENLGRHNTYAFNFSDQYVIAENLRIPEVRTRMAFENRLVTYLFYWLSKSGFFSLLKHKWIREIVKSSLMKLKMGTDVYSLKAEAFGTKLSEPASTYAAVVGSSEAQVTAMVAARVAEELLNDPLLSKGVFHIESLFEPKAFIETLTGIRFSSGAEFFPISMIA